MRGRGLEAKPAQLVDDEGAHHLAGDEDADGVGDAQARQDGQDPDDPDGAEEPAEPELPRGVAEGTQVGAARADAQDEEDKGQADEADPEGHHAGRHGAAAEMTRQGRIDGALQAEGDARGQAQQDDQPNHAGIVPSRRRTARSSSLTLDETSSAMRCSVG